MTVKYLELNLGPPIGKASRLSPNYIPDKKTSGVFLFWFSLVSFWFLVLEIQSRAFALSYINSPFLF